MLVLQSTTIRFSPNKKEMNENLVYFDMNRLETSHRMFLKKNSNLRIERNQNRDWILTYYSYFGYHILK